MVNHMKISLQLTDSHELKDMTTHSVEVVSTSSVTADTSPVVLNQTDSLRFRFLPTLVTNEKDPQNPFPENWCMKESRGRNTLSLRTRYLASQ